MMAAFRQRRTSVQQALFNGGLVPVLQGAKLVNQGNNKEHKLFRNNAMILEGDEVPNILKGEGFAQK